MKDLSINTILECMGELFSDELSIAVADTKEYIFYKPSKRIDLRIKPGQPIKEGTMAYKAIHSGQKVSEFIDRDVFGVPYHGIAMPFLNNGVPEGCVTAIYPTLTNGKSVVTLKTLDGWVPIPFAKVIYIEAKDKKTHVYAQDLEGTHKYSLNEFEFFLPKDSFIRCHRSFIVNVNHIKEIFPDIHSTFLLSMSNGQSVPVSQTYSSYFRKLLGF
ncbi:LytTR family DNA-binding domain-containing protein [Pullulanibacillus sp. KACC 23026]|uniref:LytTR family DNA-binding domain-containing protein n=1 Tax=Pullulanibacillus sp. KACC 23026 TaxID=3028315 RepID=UPI0023B045B8|nr:LytTR family DNA-binding domain-containing protein [Pullulanibacillus sp. KACC 23026]WEG12888.1 LytTR family DNA-binding domain-containing protein [Pullulanibacillus sp. KACC 23026]